MILKSIARFRSLRLALSLTVLACIASPLRAGIVHRWSFDNPAGPAVADTEMQDSISGAIAAVRGNGAFFDGARLTIPGTTHGAMPASSISAYVDLPNFLLSSKTDISIEIWATPISNRMHARLFDFGKAPGVGDGTGAAGEWTGQNEAIPDWTVPPEQSLAALTQSGEDLNTQMISALNSGTGQAATSNLPSSYGTAYHYVVTFQSGVGAYPTAGGRFTMYRDGVLAAQIDTPFRLSNFADVNNWLGRSAYLAEPLAHAAYDELRIYTHALSPAEIASSHASGPNAVITVPPPSPQQDLVKMHHLHKARVRVLDNDTGFFDPSSLEILQPPQSGTAVMQADRSILYTHTTGNPLSDTFTYRIWNYLRTSSAVSTVTVEFANTLRIANPSINVPSTPPANQLSLNPAFPGAAFDTAVAIASAPGDTQKLFVVQLPGFIRVVPDIQSPSAGNQVFLDLPALLESRGLGESIDGGLYGEFGLMGLAFHPQYATNRRFFVFYTVKIGTDYFQRISRFTTQAANPLAADPDSEVILIEQRDRAGNHNGGDLHFGPDGYLYISLGDEGSQYDEYQNSQRIDHNFFSGMLRIDVDKRPGNLEPTPHEGVPTDSGIARYSVPADNPFVGADELNGEPINVASLRTEFWAIGLRNPWRFSFDPATGELWCGDVGQDFYEEVDVLQAGGNYGWCFRKGAHEGYPGTRTVPAGFTSLDPLYEYSHTGQPGDPKLQGNSITGGVVYRGTRIPELTGAYIFADFVTGNIWALRKNGQDVTVDRIAGLGSVTAISTDPSNGDVLFVVLAVGQVNVFRLEKVQLADTFPQTLSATGLFADLTDLSPSPGVHPYTPNLTFWSDHAIKQRWFTLPNAAAQFTPSLNDSWTYPAGTIWVKHFDMEMTRGNPATRKRIETRMLVRNATGAYGVSYKWNAAQTEATLVPDAGEDFPLAITVDGSPTVQSWRIPSRTECSVCHNAPAGYSLSFNTRQLNRTGMMDGFSGNQLELLRSAGYLTHSLGSPNLLPRHVRPDETQFPVEARARSYLAVNCSYCHRADGLSETWDGRPELTLAQTSLINGVANSNGGNPANKLVVPGDLNHSVVYNRVALTNGFTRMPPIGSSVLDQTGIALLQEWINESLPNRATYDTWREAWFQYLPESFGEPGEDPERDGRTNHEEYLAGTNPLDGMSFFGSQLTRENNTVSVHFNVPANRSVRVETSTDLTNWFLWDVPQNNGIPLPGGASVFQGPMLGPKQFFRLQLSEN